MTCTTNKLKQKTDEHKKYDNQRIHKFRLRDVDIVVKLLTLLLLLLLWAFIECKIA